MKDRSECSRVTASSRETTSMRQMASKANRIAQVRIVGIRVDKRRSTTKIIDE